MCNFEQMVKEFDEVRVDPESYFRNFFDKGKLKNYSIDAEADKNAIKAIKTMFGSSKNLLERCEKALTYDPLCREAFFVYYLLSEDIYVNYRFEAYYDQLNAYGDLSAYQKKCYLIILSFYVDFLMDIGNYTRGIRVQRQIMRLTSCLSHKEINCLSFMYSQIEEADDFYRLFLDRTFDAYDYLLLIVTLLKHEDMLRAKEVTKDMLKNIEYASYLDHLWDLDDHDEKQRAFYEVVDDLYDSIRAIPDFFTFINMVREESEGTLKVL